ncbi:hypothetical protein CQW49_22330 (plasmid) [Methylosinus trichosporium OB3b]|uniref:DUF2726 domain-containing protein n=2 Tax=Methylosinus trichosporium TaxID=426 RepID=A0A2D2D6U4_METT3|nr:hypothetical protein CQW49_22330 [Methylosinus trichosporium OB3b]
MGAPKGDAMNGDRGAGISNFIEGISGGNGALLVALSVLLLALLAFIALVDRRPAYRRGRFLTANEKRFLSVLDEAVGEGFRVFAQVRLAELVDVDLRVRNSKRRAAMNKVFGKSIDFVICNSTTLEPVAAIELDDRTHALPHRRERDIFVDAVFGEIGIPLLRARARRAYSVAMLEPMLREAGVVRMARPDLRSIERG